MVFVLAEDEALVLVDVLKPVLEEGTEDVVVNDREH